MFTRIVIVGAGKTTESIVERLSLVAPVLVLDKSEANLEHMAMPGDAGSAPGRKSGRFRHPISRRLGDGTSRLVLEDARGEAREDVALVAAAGDDRANLEICRLAKELGFRPVVAIAIDPAEAPNYERHDVRAIVRSTVLGQTVERAMQFEGLSMATTVGLGKGEIVEFRVLPSSPVIGVPLRSLDATGWRIAAIYRSDRLVLPTGQTPIEADDRVVVVGDPRILPLVAENLRIGLPMFPVGHGPNVVVYLPDGRDRETEQEAEVVTLKTRASGLVRVWPGARADSTLVEDAVVHALGSTEAASKTFADKALEGTTLEQHIRCLVAARPGVVIAKAVGRTAWERIAGEPGRDGALCDALTCPVIFPRGAAHYRRVVHALAEASANAGTAETAIDLARMFDLPLEIVRVDLPAYIGAAVDLDGIMSSVERRARLHQINASVTRLEGNPIDRVIEVLRPDDLAILTRRRGARDGYTRPDIALRIARASRSSVLVATVDDE